MHYYYILWNADCCIIVNTHVWIAYRRRMTRVFYCLKKNIRTYFKIFYFSVNTDADESMYMWQWCTQDFFQHQNQEQHQDFLQTKTKTLFFVVLEAPWDQDIGLEDYTSGVWNDGLRFRSMSWNVASSSRSTCRRPREISWHTWSASRPRRWKYGSRTIDTRPRKATEIAAATTRTYRRRWHHLSSCCTSLTNCKLTLNKKD